MSDHTKSDSSSSDQHNEFERDLALTSHAYKNAEVDLPSVAMDDAIHAAARRAVKSHPHAINKSWISRWSTPISAAALVVLSVSVGLIAIDEQPDLAPASLKEVARPKAAAPPAITRVPSIAPESAAPAAVIASDLPQPARLPEKKARLDLQSVAPREQIAASAKPDLAPRRNEADGAASGNLMVKDSGRAVVPFVPAPPLAEVATRQESAGQSAAETTKREAPQIKQLVPQVATASVAARGDVTELALQKSVAAAAAPKPPLLANATAIAPPVHAAPATSADKANEPPDIWMKRILELKRLERTREFEEELTKFRKRYPGFALPEELKERK